MVNSYSFSLWYQNEEGGGEWGKNNAGLMGGFENAILSILTSLTCGFYLRLHFLVEAAKGDKAPVPTV